MKGFLKTTKGKLTLGGAVLLLAAIIALTIFLINKPQGYRSISVSEVYGSVLAENDGKAYSAYENMRIGGGYALITETDSYTRLILDDDKYIRLEQLSRATFKELGTENKRNTVINLVSGTLTTEIVKPLKLEEEYVINTPNAVLSVRGTYFRTEVSKDANGDYYTDVYTYGGTVACRRIMPDGSIVDEEVLIGAGYKACVKMDEIITVYVEELIEEGEDKVDPFDIPDMVDDDLVGAYNASANGHKMFRDTEDFWNEIDNRDIDISKYKSPYDNEDIPPYVKKEETSVSTTAFEISSDEASASSSSATPASSGTTTVRSTTVPESGMSMSAGVAGSSDNTGETDNTANDSETAETETSSVTTEADVQAETDKSEESRRSESGGNTSVSEAAPIVTSYTGSTLTEPVDDDYNETDNSDESDNNEVVAEEEEDLVEAEAEESEENEITEEIEEDSIYDEAFYDEDDLFDYAEPEEDDEIITPSDNKQDSTVTSTTDDDVEPMISTPSYIYTGPVVTSSVTSVSNTGDIDIIVGIPVGTTATTTTSIITTTTTTTPEEITEHICVFENYISDNNATCTEDGTKTAVCECGKTDTVTDEGSATGHTEKSTITDATCTEAGKTVISCETCGEIISEKEIPAFGHTEVEETKEATFAETGLYVKYCSVCDELLDRKPLERLPALYTEDGDITITSTGYTQGEAAAETAFTGDYVISQRDSSTAVDCAIAIESGTHNVTLDGLNIATSDDFAFIVETDSVVNLTTSNEVNFDSAYQVICSYGTLNFNNCNLSLICIDTDRLYPTALVNGGLMSINNSVIKITSKYDGISNELWNEGFSINNSNITINSTDHGIYTNSEPFAINSGYLNINTDKYGLFINNDGQFIITGGSIVINGENCDFAASTDYEHVMIVTGGSVHFVNSIIEDGVIITNGTDPLECVVYDTFPTEAERTFTNSDGTSYIYALDEADKADDGRYYIWKPVSVTPEGLEINAVNFPDEVFRTYVSNNFDTDSNGYLSDEEIAAVTSIDVSGSDTADGGVASLTGIEHFTNLDTLYCKFNGALTSLDTSKNTLLRDINCYETGITAFDFSNNTALTDINVGHTAITELDVTANTELTTLIFGTNNITAIDLSNNTKLTYLNCGENPLTELDVSSNPDLWYLNFSNTAVSYIDVSNNTELLQIHCYNCALTCADLTNNTKLGTFSANDNKYPIPSNAVSFDTSLLKDFDPIKVSAVTNAEFDAAAGVFRMITGDVTYTYDCGQGFAPTFTLTRTGEATEGIAVDSVNFPDEVFRDDIVSYCDDDNNGYLSSSEIEAVKKLNPSSKYYGRGIESLKGIEYFTSLEYLDCSGNVGFIEFDISKNTALTYLDCSDTGITSLDVSKNTALTRLDCFDTGITSLDVSKNTALTQLYCYSSALAYIDLTNNTNLSIFQASGNEYVIPSNATTFDTSTIDGFDPSKVSDVTGADFDADTGIFTNITGDITYTYDCGQGYSETFTLTRTGEATEGIAVDSVNFPDEVFRNYVSTNFDTDGSGYLSDAEIEAATEIDVSGNYYVDGGITSLNGVEHFTVLTKLVCSYNTGLTELCVSNNTALTYLGCSDIGITSLDVSNNTALEKLYCYETEITSLDVSNNTALKTLYCDGTEITSLDVGKNIALTDLYCGNTGITSLDVSKNIALTDLYCGNTVITNLDVSKNIALRYLSCGQIEIANLDVSNNTALEILYCDNTKITTLDVSNNTDLVFLDCSGIEITNLDVSNNIDLTTLLCYRTRITELDVRGNTNLIELSCHYSSLAHVDLTNNTKLTSFNAANNKYSIPVDATTFDTSTIDGFDPSKVSDVTGADFDADTGIFTNITGDITYTYDCGQGYSVTFTLKRSG